MKKMEKYKKYWPGAIILFLLLLIVILLLFTKNKSPAAPPSSKSSTSASQKVKNNPAGDSETPPISSSDFISNIHSANPEKIIMKVGNENIYQRDYDIEWAYYPIKNNYTEKIIKNKLIRDSKIIQIARDEKITGIPEAGIYDTPQKDYMRRIKAVEKSEKDIKEKILGLRGTVVSIWFLNDHVGPLGLDKSRQLAYEKIKDLHDKVKSSRLTIDQAGEAIMNDTGLASIDPSYKLNAIFRFDTSVNTKITWEEDFNSAIMKLNQGETTEIFTGKSFDFDRGGVKTEAYYLFGQVTSKQTENVTKSFEDYFTEKSPQYEVLYF